MDSRMHIEFLGLRACGCERWMREIGDVIEMRRSGLRCGDLDWGLEWGLGLWWGCGVVGGLEWDLAQKMCGASDEYLISSH